MAHDPRTVAAGPPVPFDARLLSGVSILSAVVEAGSFVRAAELLNMTASGVSHGIARLEARVGARLFHRTTRALHLTDEGRRS
jgi:DNA-binding transcriptional LysR family regulator